MRTYNIANNHYRDMQVTYTCEEINRMNNLIERNRKQRLTALMLSVSTFLVVMWNLVSMMGGV